MDNKSQIQTQQKLKRNNIYQKQTALSKYIFVQVQTLKPLHAMIKNTKLKNENFTLSHGFFKRLNT